MRYINVVQKQVYQQTARVNDMEVIGFTQQVIQVSSLITIIHSMLITDQYTHVY